MSCYYQMAKHPVTGIPEEAFWIDDYYGHHEYGVKFSDGQVFRPSVVDKMANVPTIEQVKITNRGPSVTIGCYSKEAAQALFVFLSEKNHW